VDIGDVDVLSIAAGDNNIGNVDIATVPAPLNVVGGGAEATALRVTLANDSTGVITVDGTVTANLSATDNAVLDSIQTAAELIDDAVYADDADWTDSTSKHILVGGLYQLTPQTITDGDVGPIQLDATGGLRLGTGNKSIGTLGANSGVVIGDVNLGATDNAVLDTIDAALDAINAKLVTGTVIGDVNLGATDNAVLDVIAAKDFATQTTLAALNAKLVTGTVIGDVNLGATDNAVLDTIDAALDAINAKLVTGTVIGDVNLGATDNAVLDTIDAALDAINAKLVTGTVIGDVNLGATDNAVLDTIDAALDAINAKLVTGTVIGDVNLGATDNAVLDSIVTNTNRAAITGYGQAKLDHADVTTAQVLVAAVADKKFYITSITLSVAAAGSYWIEDDDAAQITCKWTLAANGGLVWSAPIDTPWKSTTANKGLKVKGSAAGVIGCMITYYTLA